MGSRLPYKTPTAPLVGYLSNLIFESRINSSSNSVDLLESKLDSRIKEIEARRLVALEERGLGEKGKEKTEMRL